MNVNSTSNMKKFNFHTHTSYSDGRHAPQTYVETAIEKGMRGLGFSDHAPISMKCDWAMPKSALLDYREEVERLRSDYEGRLEVYCGLEIDYIPGIISPRDALFKELRLDYTIGSVHYVDHFKDGTPWSIDGSANIFRAGLKQIFQDDIRLAVHRYFQLIREMVRKAPPTIVAHIDRLKKHNREQMFFDEREKWYRAEMTKTLECIAERGLILEINTKALYRRHLPDPYPGGWVLEIAREMGIPVHLASDAHLATDLTGGFDEAFKMLWDCGYRALRLLDRGAWRSFPINEWGLISPESSARA